MRDRPALRQQQRLVLLCVSSQGKSTPDVAGKDNQRMQADQIPPLQVLFDSEFSFGGIGRLILDVQHFSALAAMNRTSGISSTSAFFPWAEPHLRSSAMSPIKSSCPKLPKK